MSKQPRPPAPPPGQANTIAPGRYPVFSAAVAMGLKRVLRDADVTVRSNAAMASAAQPMRDSVLAYLVRIEEAARADDHARLYQDSHEIRGLAGNAGLAATAKVANELCRYLDAFARAGRTPERAVIRLHLEAAARSVAAADETSLHGEAVVRELAQLVDKKLAEINGPETL